MSLASEEGDELKDRTKILLQTRKLCIEALSRFSDYVKDFSDDNKIYHLQARLEKIQSLWSEFNGVQSELESLDTSTDHSDLRINFEDEFFEFTGEARGILDRYFFKLSKQNGSQQQTSTAVQKNNNANLPKVKLPEFYGAYEKWLPFSNTYQSLIHNNFSISNVEKFWYLKSCLKGDAANVLTSLEVSEENYGRAWDILCERYQNKRVIIQTHMKGIFDIPCIARESHLSLRNLTDNFTQHLRALESLGLPVKSWDAVMVYHLSTKLDHRTRREWEDFSLKLATDVPSISDLISFLNKRCQVLENLDSGKTGYKPAGKPSGNSSAFVATGSPRCISCKREHFIFNCPEFLKITSQERLNKIRKLHACTNCLRLGHTSRECTSTFSCKKCSARHNSLLHLNRPIDLPREEMENTPGSSGNNSQSLSVTNIHPNESYILLSTANILVFDSIGKPHSCRALLDNCSQSNFITQRFFDKLNIPTVDITHFVEGFGNHSTKILKGTSVSLKSNVNSFSLDNVSFLVTDQITKNLPEISFDPERLDIPKNIKLADRNFNKSGPIDILLGASIFWNLICIGQIKLANGMAVLQKTKLGWIVSGPLPSNFPRSSICNISLDNSSLSKQLERFWKLEECHINSFRSREELECEDHFVNTAIRDSSGKFIVSLPFNDNVSELGNSFDSALKRFYSLERKLNRNPTLKAQYNNFMSEYEELGHMSKVESSTASNDEVKEFFLPHHGVIKESSSTTRLRVVFDGSAKSTSGLSLNDTLKVGPKLQDDLMDIAIRFRTYKYAFTADIEKMYRCVLVQEDHRNYQKILWRFSSSDKIDVYRLNTVTYGTASASFLAVRSLQQLAAENKQSFPDACEAILSSFYVDDLICGSRSIDDGKRLISEITQILGCAGFNLRKWVANNPDIIVDVSTSQTSLKHKTLSDKEATKTLGLVWNSQDDVLQYTVQIATNNHVTKRSILAVTAQIFDPMGLIGPCIITAKLILQTLWQLGLDWDEAVPMNLHSRWTQFCSQIPLLNNLKIPRYILSSNPVCTQLHGFSDASQKAYGACCYLRSRDSSGKIHVTLICAKSRVAPLKTCSLPRLELCASLLLVRLSQRLIKCLKINIDQSFFWTDSTIVLSWISYEPNQLNTFVANRISEIQQSTKVNQWHHVPSAENPADIISRGLDPGKLESHHLWWSGPSFLSEANASWPDVVVDLSDPPELKRKNITLITQTNDISFIQRCSSFTKLQRIVAFCLRFISNLRVKSFKQRALGPLSNLELSKALVTLSKLIQSRYFLEELRCLQKLAPLPSRSNILRLNPFLDENGLIRVGGRLKHSELSYSQKHPILLPSKDHLTKLIIRYEHCRHLHAGPQATLSAVRMNFWPLNGRNVVRGVLRSCINCFKTNPIAMSYQMGDLPKLRVTPQRPFYTTGVDFAGPFMIKDGKAKNRTLIKGYLCIFVCFATKAAHLELAGDLSTESFLNCMKRFVSRRGICGHVYSDNGTNFVGAERELREILTRIKRDSKFLDFLSINDVNWHFSPPYGPNFGGLWEACIKSAKFHLKRTVGRAHLTHESLSTIFAQIEAVLNSRPLLPLSNDPNDFYALTPSHFLIGEALTALPQTDVTNVCENRLSHFNRLQQQVQHFWRKWSNHYLNVLQERSKWNKRFPNLSVGTLVLIKDENSAPLFWKMGRVVNLYPGTDNVIRVVDIKTISGIVKRTVSKICALPLEN